MREILFKAKREDNGEWVEGNLVHCKASVGISELCLIVCSAEWLDNPKWFNLCNTHYVNPKTVCQYTGLKDKNGRKIFEGDIVNCLEAECCGKIEFEESEAEFVFWVLLEGNRYEAERISEYLSYMEVIGNIFDNLELLGV